MAQFENECYWVVSKLSNWLIEFLLFPKSFQDFMFAHVELTG